MGVHGLWELLAPVGRRVSVETLAGKKLAIDASIWMIQFMKAMRDDKGEMVRNAHILGFFRRICKLLFLRTKPVFVFDGATPALKRRTVIARRRQRENAQAKIRKTAEKLLLNHLKAMRLKELANDLENQRQMNNVKKGKKGVMDADKTEAAGNSVQDNATASKCYDQEAIDAMLAASLADEGSDAYAGDASTSGAGILAEEEDEDGDEEMLLPELQGKIDPAVLAALPPSMQLDLLTQMRERLMAENRQKYQKVKKAPAKFSELQIQAYLKTVAFRRDIDEVRKSAGGRGIGGMKTSRIASEANREFIFSSSFTGNRQALASSGGEGNINEQNQTPMPCPSPTSLNGGRSTQNSDTAIGSTTEEQGLAFDKDVETYLDERGRVRVSKVRAMGIRMTRDLQRNLDLMKEIEQQRINPNTNANDGPYVDKAADSLPSKHPEKSQLLETLYGGNDRNFSFNGLSEETLPITGTSIEVSFDDDSEKNSVDSDDDLFAQIVAADPLVKVSSDNTSSKKQASNSVSDCEWEEGVAEDLRVEVEPSLAECIDNDESEVEWEEGGSSSIPEQTYINTVCKGALEEEANFQEAIRRSIQDAAHQKLIDVASVSGKLEDDSEVANNIASFVPAYTEKGAEPSIPSNNVFPPHELSYEEVPGADGQEFVAEKETKNASDSPCPWLETYDAVDSDCKEEQVDKPCESSVKLHPEFSREDAKDRSLEQAGNTGQVKSTGEKQIEYSEGLREENSNRSAEVFIGGNSLSDVNMPHITLMDAPQSDKVAMTGHVNDISEPNESVLKELRPDFKVADKFTEKSERNGFYEEREYSMYTSNLADQSKEQVEITEASLEEEMINLNKERTDLSDEQRKLERNAESVSGEMFAECQELLQMFGLPYIIAPMEAEAQCAFMELENLVDGVVTDDSDVFLFGARSVYKNIFDDRKYVETYFMKDIESELGLTREKLIRMALLLGSDYTEGVSGIGIVNAIEVLNAFSEEDGLREFREWIESPDPTILGKVDIQAGSSLRNAGSDSNAVGVSESNQEDDFQRAKRIFMNKHRNVSKNWHIPSTFPSEAVISAYASPQVDNSTDSFSWGKPDLFVLRKLCWEKFGWSTVKADELLQPVLKEYNKHETQLRLEAFYTFNEKFAKIRSKRINNAVKGITGNRSSELMDGSEADASKGRKKRKIIDKHDEDNIKEHATKTDDAFVAKATENSAGKQSRKTVTLEEPWSSEAVNSEPPPIQVTPKKNLKGKSNASRRGRGRGRSQSVGRGRKKKSAREFSEASSSDGNSGESEQELHTEQCGGLHGPRRSMRTRKTVKYTVNDIEIDESITKEGNENFETEEAEDLESFNDEETFVNAMVSGPSGSSPCEVGDPLNDVNLSRDNFELGGGFCMDEAEIELGTSQQEQCHNEEITELSKEYLKMGGGFCLDDGEDAKDQGKCTSIPSDAFIFKDHIPSHSSILMEEAENDVGTSHLVSDSTKGSNEWPSRGNTEASENKRLSCENATSIESNSKLVISEDKAENDNFVTRPVSYLSAMPNLRRKRRKN